MMSSEKKLRMSIDAKRYTIYIGKEVIRQLDNPSYISLLVNQHTIAVIPCDENHVLPFQVPEEMEGQGRMRIYSTSFIRSLCIEHRLDENRSYVLNGTYHPDIAAVVFNLPHSKTYS